jgi:hypothetical protein
MGVYKGAMDILERLLTRMALLARHLFRDTGIGWRSLYPFALVRGVVMSF